MSDQTYADFDTLAAALRAGAGLVPLQRRVRSHRAEFNAILGTGITVRALADALASRGVTDRRGAPLSYSHLRVLLARIGRPNPLGAATWSASEAVPISRGVSPVTSANPIAPPADRPDFSRGLFRPEELKRE